VPAHPLHIALAAIETDKGGLVRSAFWLWLALTAVGLTALAVLWLLTASLTRTARGLGRKPRRRRIKDAWAESGRRVEPISHDDIQPDADDPDASEEGEPR
jgi:hypothetical protein